MNKCLTWESYDWAHEPPEAPRAPDGHPRWVSMTPAGNSEVIIVVSCAEQWSSDFRSEPKQRAVPYRGELEIIFYMRAGGSCAENRALAVIEHERLVYGRWLAYFAM